MDALDIERFTVTYQIEADTYEEAKQIAWSVQVEQTIEFPYERLQSEYIRDHVVGRLVSLEAVDSGGYRAVISYADALTAYEATQFLNVVFGNSSLQPHIWVVDIHISEGLAKAFGGPRFGLDGLRRLCHTPRRALMQAVIKPMGTPTDELASMCRAYALGGADVIKDDHGITNQSFAPFKERVKRCAAVVHEANAKSGGHTLYAANVSADGEAVLERAHFAKEAGATALMVAPALTGFGWLQRLAKDESLGLPLIVHPAMMGGFALPGTSGIADYLWIGFLPRLFGGDMPIFVSYGGRFTFTAEQCKRIHEYISRPMPGLRAACPSPGGGVTEARLPELLKLYGNDTMFLVGGDMFRRGNDLESNMRFFVDMLEQLSV